VTKIRSEIGQWLNAASLAYRLLHLFDSSYRDPRLAPGFARIGSLGDSIRDIPFDVKRQFLIELAIGALAMHQRAHAFQQLTENRHG
jgi:hypothetical protein